MRNSLSNGKSFAVWYSSGMISTQDAAARLGVTRRRVLALIADGRLPAQKLGRDWLIEEKDLAKVEDRPPGRPPAGDKATARKGRKA
jgi:excisionase family DNA binding protein